MCKFFSFDSDGKGKFYYFDWKLRKQILSGKLQDYEPDSHTSIADYFGFKGVREDKLNKYEYNPLTKDFVVDQINTTNDSKQAEKWANRLDFSKVVKPLILKPIIHPFKIKAKKVTKVEIKLLQKWNSVWNSVRDSVWNSVRDSVWNSVWNSVGDSVWACLSGFFKIKYKYSYKSCIKLWEKGFVPSFDGKIWRLHAGEKAEIVFEISQKELKNYNKEK